MALVCQTRPPSFTWTIQVSTVASLFLLRGFRGSLAASLIPYRTGWMSRSHLRHINSSSPIEKRFVLSPMLCAVSQIIWELLADSWLVCELTPRQTRFISLFHVPFLSCAARNASTDCRAVTPKDKTMVLHKIRNDWPIIEHMYYL
ncbi:hypothetical protein EDB87DRAFT_213540 [Lactarius vividus]|nr:hypothetical protein EDB87DRAFT_213540 [Lactarius vividus]